MNYQRLRIKHSDEWLEKRLNFVTKTFGKRQNIMPPKNVIGRNRKVAKARQKMGGTR